MGRGVGHSKGTLFRAAQQLEDAGELVKWGAEKTRHWSIFKRFRFLTL